jgi:hypothetical protein
MWLTFQKWRDAQMKCDSCGWSGPGNDTVPGAISAYDYFLRCPRCEQIVDAVRTPTIEEARTHWDELDEPSRMQVLEIEQRQKEYRERRLAKPEQLPDLPGTDILLTWDMMDREGGDVVIKHGDNVIWSEPSDFENYERFEEVADLLLRKYGQRLTDLVPTEVSKLYLYGDRISAPKLVDAVRERIRANHAAGGIA